MSVVLPTPESNPGKAEWSEVYANDKALKEAHETLEAEFKASTRPVTWYTPKVIATEESRSNTAFGTLTTPDEITGVVVPANSLVQLTYSALVGSSVEGAGRVAVFVGSNQLKSVGATTPAVQEASTSGTPGVPRTCMSNAGGLGVSLQGTSFVTTGLAHAWPTASGEVRGGPVLIHRLAAGTYSFSIQFKATSGSITAKERLLQVAVVGS